MTIVTFIASPHQIDPNLVEGANALSPFVLRVDAKIDVSFENTDVVHLEDEIDMPKLFLADMDSTMIGQECIDELADYAGVKDKVSEVTERAMRGELDFEGALRERVALLKGLPESALEDCYNERIVPNLGATELLDGLGKVGAHRMLVSGGFTFFASRVAETLGFDEYHANVLGIKDGVLTGEVEGEIVNATKKAEILRSNAERLNISMRETVAIGDGANDIPMIEAAGIGIAYHAKPKLREVADICLDYAYLDALIDILPIRKEIF